MYHIKTITIFIPKYNPILVHFLPEAINHMKICPYMGKKLPTNNPIKNTLINQNIFDILKKTT